MVFSDLFLVKGGLRLGVVKIFVVVIFGRFDNVLGVVCVFMVLKENYVIVLLVGIGEEVDMEELLLMVLIVEDVIIVRFVSVLKKWVVGIRDKVCEGE